MEGTAEPPVGPVPGRFRVRARPPGGKVSSAPGRAPMPPGPTPGA